MKRFGLFIVATILSGINGFATSSLYIRLSHSSGDFAQVGQDLPNTPTPNHPDFAAIAWTNSSVNVNGRHLFKFNLSQLPAGAILTHAKLSLFANNNPYNVPHSTASGSNAAFIRRVIAPWNSATACFNNQPGFTTTNQVLIGPTTSVNQNFLQIDVTDLFLDIIASGQNDGLILMLQTEQKYRCMNFASGANADTSLLPLLEVEYQGCNDFNFNDGTGFGDGVVTNVQPMQNYSGATDFVAFATNIAGVQFTGRSLFKLDLSSLPLGASINSASVSLYANPASASGFPLTTLSGDNDCLLLRTNQNWGLSGLSYLNQPSVTLQNSVLLSHPTSAAQDYLNVDITGIISDMYLNQTQGTGVLLQLINETGNKSLNFCSSNHPDSLKRPVVKICYTSTSGIQGEIVVHPTIQSYPNPASDEVRFSGSAFITSYVVTSIDGKVVLSSIFSQPLSQLVVPAAKLPGGYYFLRAFGPEGTWVSKFMIR